MRKRGEHNTARVKAFAWYLGDPPTPERARCHFAAEARRDPGNLLLYEEALRIFLSTCWQGDRTSARSPQSWLKRESRAGD